MILDFIFEPRCVFCKKIGKYICENCYEKLNNKYLFQKVEKDYFDYIYCGSFYNDLIKKQIHNFKFHDKPYLYKYFIELSLTKNEKIFNFLKKFDLITYIPMNNQKELKRGYNQSKLLAKELGKRLKIDVLKTLEKPRIIKTQSSLSEEERKINARGAFEFIDGKDIKNKNIILVDDILTTGSTARSASKILKLNGANKICVFAISKTTMRKYSTEM